MTARPQENVVNNIALLPLPEPPRWCITGAEQKTELCTWADNYARANVDSAVIHLRAELRSEMATTKQLRQELDEWLRGCPDPSKVSPEWLVKKPSRLLWRCRDALASAQARDAEIARWKDAAEMQSAITKSLLPYQDEAVAGRAEIEALRAEVERLTGVVRGMANEIADRKHRTERLEEALRWALPLAAQGIEMHRLERIRCGHTDITGTYKNGTTWVGISQQEIDDLEKARTALSTNAATQTGETT